MNIKEENGHDLDKRRSYSQDQDQANLPSLQSKEKRVEQCKKSDYSSLYSGHFYFLAIFNMLLPTESHTFLKAATFKVTQITITKMCLNIKYH